MKKLFRFHRGSLADSLATTIEVSGAYDLMAKIIAEYDKFAPPGYLKNIRTSDEPIKDDRLPEEWNGLSFYVLADIPGYEGQCIGMSNFRMPEIERLGGVLGLEADRLNKLPIED